MSKPTELDKKLNAVANFLKGMYNEIRSLAPAGVSPEKIARSILLECRDKPDLLEVSGDEFKKAVLAVAQTGLLPGAMEESYILPKKRKGTPIASFTISYKGYLKILRNTGLVATIYANPVYENDAFEFLYGSEAFLSHRPALDDPGDVVYYYFYVKFLNGAEFFNVESKKQIEKHAEKHSDNYNSTYSAWKTDFDQMALKTVFLQRRNFLPYSIELKTALKLDSDVDEEKENREIEDIDLTEEPDPEPKPKNDPGEVTDKAKDLIKSVRRLANTIYKEDAEDEIEKAVRKITEGGASSLEFCTDAELDSIRRTLLSQKPKE